MSDGRVLVTIDCQPEIGEQGFLNTANPPTRGHRYYAMQDPRVLLITYRFPLEGIQIGDCYDAQVGWNPGTIWAVRPGNGEYQHRRIALSGLAGPTTPHLDEIPLSQLISQAPQGAPQPMDPLRISDLMGAHASSMAAGFPSWLAKYGDANLTATLDLISRAANGAIKRDSTTIERVEGATDRVVAFLTRAVWHTEDHPVDPGFWKSDVGDVCARAKAWCLTDVWLTPTEAAMVRYGRAGRNALDRLAHEAAARGWVVRRERGEVNDNRSARYLRSQVKP